MWLAGFKYEKQLAKMEEILQLVIICGMERIGKIFYYSKFYTGNYIYFLYFLPYLICVIFHCSSI